MMSAVAVRSQLFPRIDIAERSFIRKLHFHHLQLRIPEVDLAAAAVLLGSHAYGVLLNHLGVRAAVYETRDVDIGRNDPLILQSELKEGILGALMTSDVRLVEAPRLNVR